MRFLIFSGADAEMQSDEERAMAEFGGQLIKSLFRRLGSWRGFCAACGVPAVFLYFWRLQCSMHVVPLDAEMCSNHSVDGAGSISAADLQRLVLDNRVSTAASPLPTTSMSPRRQAARQSEWIRMDPNRPGEGSQLVPGGQGGEGSGVEMQRTMTQTRRREVDAKDMLDDVHEQVHTSRPAASCQLPAACCLLPAAACCLLLPAVAAAHSSDDHLPMWIHPL